MPLPVDLTTVTVTGNFPSGGVGISPLAGTVTFAPSTDLTDSVGHVIIRAAPVEASLDYTGSFSVALVCTDNTDLSPTGWTWTVTERIVGLPTRTYSVLLPASDGPSIDLSDLVEVTPVTPPAGALLAVNNLADVASPSVSRTHLGLGPLATLAESGNASQYLNGQGGWTIPAGGGGGVQIGGDLGGTNAVPLVTGTHLGSPLPLAQGGTSAADAPGARTALGLGTAATQPSSAFDAAGAAAAAVATAAASAAATYVPLTAEGTANGVATLDGSGRLAAAQAANLLAAANNLSDVPSASTARGNLGLGGSAVLNVGTSAGTVAAGDDSRITGAAQKTANLSDLANAATSRGNLGLGGAATLGVGTGAGTVAAGNDTRITGALQAASNLSDLPNAGTARTNLALGGAALLNVGSTAGTVAAGDDSRITGAAQKASNLSDLASAPTARTNLGLGGAATLNVGTSAGTVAAGDDSRITGAAQKASNLSDLASAETARTNLALGTQAQQNFGTLTGALAEVVTPYACAVVGGSQLTAAILILNLIRPGPVLVTNLGIWLTLAGVTASGANGLALYTEAGVLIDQTGDMSAAFAGTGYIEAALGAQQQLSANASYYIGVLSHFSGTAPKAASALAGQAIPVIKGHYLSLTKSATATFPGSFTPSALTTSTAAYYMAMT